MDDSLEKKWLQIKQTSHTCLLKNMEILTEELKSWPDSIRKISWIEDIVCDDWWTEGYDNDCQPWLGLVRTLHTNSREIYSMPSSSAWGKFGFPAITRLELTHVRTVNEVEMALARLPAIKDLVFTFNTTLRKQDWPFFFDCLPPLRSLDVMFNPIGSSGLEILIEKQAKTLEKLNLQNTMLGVDGLKKLNNWPEKNQLRYLNIKNNSLDFSRLVYLEGSNILSGLQQLDLSGFLTPSKHFKWLQSNSIQSLTIEGKVLEGKALDKFASQCYLPNLQVLNIANPISIRAVRTRLCELGWTAKVQKFNPATASSDPF